MRRSLSTRRGPLLVTALAVIAACLATIPAATAATAEPMARPAAPAPGPPRPPHLNDVYIRDIAGDVGFEPDPLSPVWASPDIWVCNTPAPCPGVNPIVGGTSYVSVHLNNTGPGTVVGDVYTYYTSLGASALWPTGWHPIGVVFSVAVPPSGITVTMPWPSVPGPGHFCLLARFVSAADPMTFPELPGSNTLDNTVNNNNIGWHNVDTVRLVNGQPVGSPFTLTNVLATPVNANLVITAPNGPFVGPGKLVVDLGPTLGKAWLAEGAPGEGVQPAGGTLVQIVDPKRAVIEGLPVQPKQSVPATLMFTGGGNAVDTTVDVDETDANGNDMGGVAYLVTNSTQG